ncbi:MAG: response regulator transcription factor [Bacteroidota bacterium]
MKKTIFVFSVLILLLLVLFQIGEYAFLMGDTSIEFIIGIIALVFLGIGLYINRSRVTSDSSGKTGIDLKKIKDLGISEREYQVLLEISNGLSNKEIGDKLYISESTIKTHVSNLLVKLDAKRRTHAIQKAKELQIIAG